MPQSIRTKFECQSVAKDKHGCTTIKLEPVFSVSGENKGFWDTTPNGHIEITVKNSSSASEMFIPGEEYYVDFSPAKVSNTEE